MKTYIVITGTDGNGNNLKQKVKGESLVVGHGDSPHVIFNAAEAVAVIPAVYIVFLEQE